jgi:hypothetical protein
VGATNRDVRSHFGTPAFPQQAELRRVRWCWVVPVVPDGLCVIISPPPMFCRPAIQQAIINGLIIGSVYYKMGLGDFAGKLACFFLLVTSVTFSNMVATFASDCSCRLNRPVDC